MVCTTSSNNTFSLTAKTGYINLPDGNVVYMWGLSEGSNRFQHPGPVLCVNQGATVTVVLHNTLPEATSLVFPGQGNVLANNSPAQPQFDGTGTMTSLAQTAAASTGSMTYQFTANTPGTYLYQSGTNPAKQVQMGLFGALIVRPSGHTNWAYGSNDSQFNPNNEYIELLSEIDPILHQAVERGQSFDMADYRARYFLINGRSFPDTIAPNGASWLPDQPYSSLVHIHPNDASNPTPALVRYLNAGTTTYPFHPHGNHSRVIGRDGQELQGAGGQDASFEKFSIPISPGQTWDVTFVWKDAENWDPATNKIEDVVTIPQQQNLAYGQYFSGSPYLGSNGQVPIGAENYNQCGEYYHVAHNHALQAITAWGVTMSGQLTYTRIDPPLPNSCP